MLCSFRVLHMFGLLCQSEDACVSIIGPASSRSE